ncbi:MAG: sulfatase [Planctomycetes bacterium]|nr:sulfatase [Planctomycetota bacterium]
MADQAEQESNQSVLKKRGGIWTVIGLLLVAGIVVVGVMKFMDSQKSETPPAPEYKAPKHLIVISIDTLRSDHLGCYGYGKKTSPTIDALAKEGVVFENHYTCYPLTLPAHLTQLTGVSSLGHRVRDNLYHRLPDEIQTLPELMKDQGFRTGAFVSAHTLKSGSGIERGFEVYDDKSVRTLEPGRLTVNERKAPETLKLAQDWLGSLGSDRFFCFIHLFDPHAPYFQHPEVGDEFQGNDLARYDGEIAYVDQAIGRFVLELKKLGLWDDTLLVITSDHGEGLGQHSELTHGYFCYDSTTHVPLIIHGAPEIEPGARVAGIARNYDLAPTLVELMGLEAKEFGKQVHGLSLVPAMRDPAKDMGLSVYIESHYAWLNANWAKIRGLRTKDSLTLFSGSEVLHFTDADQNKNVAGENAEAVTAARVEIDRLLKSWLPPREGSLEVRESTAGTPYPGESPVAQSFDPENLNDTQNLPSPHSQAKVLLGYQQAELDYDAQRFATCADHLRELLKDNPDFVMALKLLSAVNQGRVRSDWKQLGVAECKRLTREAADALKRTAELAGKHHQQAAVADIRRNQGLLLVWLNDKLALRQLSEATSDPALDWMFHLVSYRVAAQGAEPEAAAAAARFLESVPASESFVKEAKTDLQRMQAGESLKLAPWEQ